MSYQKLLQTIATDKPIFDIKYAILSAPIRHTFMMAMVWYLTKTKKSNDMQILEIGSWYGASALSWAQGLKLHNNNQGTITCVDAWVPFFDRKLHQDEVYAEMESALNADVAYNIFLHNIGTLPKSLICQHLRGASERILPLLRDASFEIVFVDGDHTYKAVKKDILNSLRLVKEGGIICGDDLNLQLHQCDKTTAEANGERDFITDPKTGRNFHPGVTLAIAEIFGKVSAWGGFWAMQKKSETWQPISLKNMPIDFPEHFPETAIIKAKDHLKDITIE